MSVELTTAAESGIGACILRVAWLTHNVYTLFLPPPILPLAFFFFFLVLVWDQVLIVGNGAVGKSSMIQRYCKVLCCTPRLLREGRDGGEGRGSSNHSLILVNRPRLILAQGVFTREYKKTIGVDFLEKKLRLVLSDATRGPLLLVCLCFLLCAVQVLAAAQAVLLFLFCQCVVLDQCKG